MQRGPESAWVHIRGCAPTNGPFFDGGTGLRRDLRHRSYRASAPAREAKVEKYAGGPKAAIRLPANGGADGRGYAVQLQQGAAGGNHLRGLEFIIDVGHAERIER